MNLLQRTLAKVLLGLDIKESAAGVAITSTMTGTPVWTDRDYAKFAEEGYRRNAVAFRCISLIARAAAFIPVCLFNGDDEVEDHDLLKLLARPSPMHSGSELIESVFTFLKISGNAYIEAVGPTSRVGATPKELYSLRPDRMKVIAGLGGVPMAYEYEANGQKVRWDVDQVSGRSPIMHLKLLNPLDDWYGMSSMDPAAYAIDQHNEAAQHNMAILQNGAVPSGAMTFKPVTIDGQSVHAPGTVIEAAEKRLKDMYSGSANHGKPMVLGGNVDWLKLGFSLEEMQMSESKLDAARDICNVFGVPHIMIVPGQSTYNNMAEAKLSLYEDTVLPLFDWFLDHLNVWLVPQFGEKLKLKADVDSIDALSPRREEKRKTFVELFDKKLITRNEVREALGYEALEDRPDFDPQAHEVTAVVGLINSGKLSKETGYEQLSDWRILPADLDASDEIERVESETETADGLLGLEDEPVTTATGLPVGKPAPKPVVVPAKPRAAA